MANRFDYVKYDETAVAQQEMFKEKFMDLEKAADGLKNGRAKSLVMTKFEEAYMWIGKAIRDEQIERNGGAELQEERNDDSIRPREYIKTGSIPKQEKK